MSARSLGLLAGYLADQLWGDPERCHPVAGFGALAARLERRLYAANRTSGAIFAATLVGATAAAGMAVEKTARRRPILRFLTTLLPLPLLLALGLRSRRRAQRSQKKRGRNHAL